MEYLYIYLPNISNSTFTSSLTFKSFKFVSFNVWGIMFKLKFDFETFEIVKETPFIEIEAFSCKNFDNFLFFNSSH